MYLNIILLATYKDNDFKGCLEFYVKKYKEEPGLFGPGSYLLPSVLR